MYVDGMQDMQCRLYGYGEITHFDEYDAHTPERYIYIYIYIYYFILY